MKTLEMDKLKEQTDEVLRWLQEQKEEIEITHQGKIVAHLVPVEQTTVTDQSDDNEAVWNDLDTLAIEVGKYWPKGVSAVDAINEDRREL